jgi:hypothetical protein
MPPPVPVVPLTQPEIEFNHPKDSDRNFANQLISQVQRELAQKKRHLVKITDRWMVCFDYLKQQEEQLLLATNPLKEEKDLFEASAAVVYGLGLHVLRQLRQAEEIDVRGALGYDYADIESCVAELGDTVRQGGRTLTPEWAAQLEREVFGECR